MLLLIAPGVCAQNASPQQPPNACDRWEKVPVPVADLPTIAEARSVGADCFAVGIYYKGKDPERFRRARWCAYANGGQFRNGNATQRKSAQHSALGVPESADADEDRDDAPETLTLAMLYVNGEGVARNLPLAKHFACQSNDWNTPESIAESLKPGERMELCGENGSEYGRRTNYVCIVLRQDQFAAELKRQRAATLGALAPGLRSAFEELEREHAAFRKANQAEEPNGTSGAVQSGMSNELDMDREWLGELKAIADGKAPAAGAKASELAALDGELNQTFQQNLKTDCHEEWCTTADEYRLSARAWLRYREAWVRFGKLRWPEIPPDQWRAWLTAQRNSQQSN